jgi:signal transduction histidine kinase
MRKFIASTVFIFLSEVLLARQSNLHLFFQNLSKLEFDTARKIAEQEPNSLYRFEMRRLTDILYYEGQTDKAKFKLGEAISTDGKTQITLSIICELEAGYLSLFYDQVKGDAFRHFHKAYQLAKRNDDPFLVKPCLLALLKYYDKEITQNTDAYLPYLTHLERLQFDTIDSIWVNIYKIIFYSEPIVNTVVHTDDYFKSFKMLDAFENKTHPRSHLSVYILFENALKFDFQNRLIKAENIYKKTIALSKDYPFFRSHRFFSHIKLMMIACRGRQFKDANQYLAMARKEIDLADTLRSSYHLNLHYSFLLNAENKNDSAFMMLKKAYAQDFQLGFRRNTLEINRLNIELETQEKENANLQLKQSAQEKENANLKLKQNRNWLISALAGVALLFLISYLAYTNQRSKNKIQAKEKEVQAMKLEKVLKDQEIFGIDSMLEGQEKERQRMADDLHDNLGSMLANSILHFKNIKDNRNLTEAEREAQMQETDNLLQETYQKVRSIAHAKNAGVNAQEGLLPAIKNFASKVSIINRLVIEVEEHGMNSRLENSLEITIFRIVQELITNIIKHAQATEVMIHLTHYEDSINLMVEDNGIGFEISQIKPLNGMGLHSIQKKIENLGGRVTIDSIPEKGTTVIIDVPLT